MSGFSDMLKKYTDMSGMTVVSMAKQCGIDRATLHKFIGGERIPHCREIVEKLGRILMLSSEDRDKLLEQYNISLMGDEVYRRRKTVKQILGTLTMHCVNEDFRQLFSFNTAVDTAGMTDVTVCGEKNELMRALAAILLSEISAGSALYIIAQPEPFICSFIKDILSDRRDTRLVHVFCADNSSGTSGDNGHNLGFFPSVCELAYCCKGYAPFYYYDNISAHINSATLLPTLIVTENYAVCADNGLDTGIIYRDPKTVDFYRRQFDTLYKRCDPLVAINYSFIDAYKNVGSYKGHRLTLDRAPSLFIMSEGDPSIRLLSSEERTRELMLECKEMLDRYCVGSDYTDVFTETGLREYVFTGRIAEIPEGRYAPSGIRERVEILRKMIRCTESGKVNYRIIAEENSVSDSLRVNIGNDSSVSFIMRDGSKRMFLMVHEQSIISAVNDYVDYLFTCGVIYGKERTLGIMSKILGEAENSPAYNVGKSAASEERGNKE